MSDEELHATAVKAVLTTASAAPYDLDDLKALATPPAQYVEVTVSRRFGGEARNAGPKSRTGWRITTRQVAATVSNAREMRKRTHAALEAVRLTVGAEVSSPIEFEGGEPIGEDEGQWSGLETWTYSI